MNIQLRRLKNLVELMIIYISVINGFFIFRLPFISSDPELFQHFRIF
jgi:hypothetical protein